MLKCLMSHLNPKSEIRNPMPPTHIFNPTPGWYSGDFHAHTNFSDGAYSPDELVALASAEGLEFLSITDHNVVDAFEALAESVSLPVIRGIEITLKIGHFNAFDVASWPDWLAEMLPGETWQQRVQDCQDSNRMMELCKAEGWLISINHPLLTPWEWRDADTLLGHLDALEIWNDPTWPDNSWANPAAVDYWTRLLNAGYRITAIGGTDYHYPTKQSDPHKPRLSLPRTYVYTENLSAAAILDAVRQQRAIVSMGETKLAFAAEYGGAQHIVGADLGRASGMIEFRAKVEANQPVFRVQLIKNGAVLAEERGEDGQAQIQWQSQIDPDEPAWFRCDVRDEDDIFLALTNPFFSGPHLEPEQRRFCDFLP